MIGLSTIILDYPSKYLLIHFFKSIHDCIVGAGEHLRAAAAVIQFVVDAKESRGKI